MEGQRQYFMYLFLFLIAILRSQSWIPLLYYSIWKKFRGELEVISSSPLIWDEFNVCLMHFLPLVNNFNNLLDRKRKEGLVTRFFIVGTLSTECGLQLIQDMLVKILTGGELPLHILVKCQTSHSEKEKYVFLWTMFSCY